MVTPDENVMPENAPAVESVPKSVRLHSKPIGSFGTENFSGYTAEEYLSELSGTRRADIFDKMRRSDPQIKMCVSAVRNPILAATWEVEPGDDTPEAKADAELVEHVLFKDCENPWSDHIEEALTLIFHGHSVFEITHKVVLDDEKFGSYVGIKGFGFRSQRTIERWNLDKETGSLASLTQYAYGDLDRQVDIASQHLIVFTLEKEGANYEGISLIRPCFGNWLRKDNYLKLNAIGIEKFAIPTPIVKIPVGKENSPELEFLKQALEVYTTHQSNYLLIPYGWEVELHSNTYDPSKVEASIEAEDKRMVKAFLANFLELGMNSSGSYALSNDLSDFFLGGIEYVANKIADGHSNKTIKDIVKLNRGPRKVYPRLKVSGISDKAGKELAEILDYLGRGRYITPDDDLEVSLRKRLKLPPMSEKGQRQVQPQQQPTTPGMGGPGAPAANPVDELAIQDLKLKLAEKKGSSMIRTAREELRALMQESLSAMGRTAVDSLIARYKRLPQAKRIDAIKDVGFTGVRAYRDALKEALSRIALEAIEGAKKEVPRARNVRLSEDEGNIQLAEFERLPPAIQNRVLAQSLLLVDTQIADLEKNIKFRFTSSLDSTDSESLIRKDVDEVVDQYAESAAVTAAAGNTAATIVNSARNAFFFSDDVVSEIESFTFENGDPQSPICQDLAGKTFAVNDPEAARFHPPLHHNCESWISVNLKGSKRAEKRQIGALKPSSPELEKHVTLSEDRCC